MNHPKPAGEMKAVAVATIDDLRQRIRQKSKLKGRQPDDISVSEVQQLIGLPPYRRDLLIEYLHQLNDEYRALHDRHLVALSKVINVSMAEVYEVATFYHHFEVVRGDDPVAEITVRVCNGLSCELHG
ncbi:MAG: NAD(P)H-dependent oxidoreductase subunit E, partial [Polynucleobacter sp.]|nr:NAD(P)H-dependent oxidoreductase subunit E [Polynucleobacter sp.]